MSFRTFKLKQVLTYLGLLLALIAFHIYLGFLTTIYYHYPQLDYVMHTLAAFLLAPTIIFILKKLEADSQLNYGLLALFIVVKWEAWEYLYEYLVQDNKNSRFSETLKDVVVTFLACLVAAYFFRARPERVVT